MRCGNASRDTGADTFTTRPCGRSTVVFAAQNAFAPTGSAGRLNHLCRFRASCHHQVALIRRLMPARLIAPTVLACPERRHEGENERTSRRIVRLARLRNAILALARVRLRHPVPVGVRRSDECVGDKDAQGRGALPLDQWVCITRQPSFLI
jgi:hypothetical protein